MQPVKRRAEPSMAIPAMNIASLGTNAGMSEQQTGWLFEHQPVERQIKATRAGVHAVRCGITEMWMEGYQMDRMVWMLKWVLALMKSIS